MTLSVGALPPLVVGVASILEVTITGASPVHSVAIDLLADGQPAWYYELWDARGTTPYLVGPFKKKGRSELTARAIDEMGCEISNGTRIFVTVQ